MACANCASYLRCLMEKETEVDELLKQVRLTGGSIQLPPAFFIRWSFSAGMCCVNADARTHCLLHYAGYLGICTFFRSEQALN